jgi:hypothetical protein
MNKFERLAKESEKKNNDIEVNIVVENSHFETISYDYAIDFVKQLDLINKQNKIGFFTGKFICGDIFEAFSEMYNTKIKHLIISSLSMNEDNIDSLKNIFLMNKLEKLTLIVSHFWYSHAKHKLYNYFLQEFKDYDVELIIAKTHAKLYLIETEHNKFFIETSANLNSCNNIEQYRLSFNQNEYEFYKNILLNIANTFKENNKELIKHSKLWEIVKNG